VSVSWHYDNHSQYPSNQIALHVRSGPGRHRRNQQVQFVRANRAKLEMRADRDRDTCSRLWHGHLADLQDLACGSLALVPGGAHQGLVINCGHLIFSSLELVGQGCDDDEAYHASRVAVISWMNCPISSALA